MRKDMETSNSRPTSKLPAWLIAATTAIVGTLWLTVVQWLTPDTLRWTLPARVVLLTIGAAALLFLCLGLLYLRVWIRSRTKVSYAVLWNADKQPICACCHGPLYTKDTYSFLCPICNIKIEPRDDAGRPLSPRDALAKVRGKRTIAAEERQKLREFPDRSEDEDKILRLVAKDPRMTTEEVAVAIEASLDIARLHLNRLFEAQFVQWYNEHQRIDPSAPKAKKGTLWRLRDDGVAYLLERGWHK